TARQRGRRGAYRLEAAPPAHAADRKRSPRAWPVGPVLSLSKALVRSLSRGPAARPAAARPPSSSPGEPRSPPARGRQNANAWVSRDLPSGAELGILPEY